MQIAVGEGDTVRLMAGEPSVQVQVRVRIAAAALVAGSCMVAGRL
jgi:hypothetical protein